MTAHHRYSIEIACPACAASGEIKVVEDAGPPFTDMPRRTYAADLLQFALTIAGDPTRMECMACGARFPRPF